MAALNTPVAADHQHVAVGAHGGDLPLDGIEVAQIHNAVGGITGRRQAVGMFGIREVAERNAVYRLVGIVVVSFEIVKAHRDNIIRHRGPMRARSINARRTFVIAVIVGQAEDPETEIIQRIGNIAGGREHRVAAGGERIVDQRFLVQPVHIKLGVEIPHILVCVGEIVVPVTTALFGLQVNAVVDQVIAGGGKPHGLHCGRRLWGRFRRRGRLHIGSHSRRFRGGGLRSLATDLLQQCAGQHAAHAQGDDQAGRDLIAF